MCNIALHNIIFLCKTFWQQCKGRNNKCSLHCLLSKLWYESLKHLCLHSLKILLKTKALAEVLVSHSSQTRVPCLLKNFIHTVRIKSSNENYIYKPVSQRKRSPCYSHCLPKWSTKPFHTLPNHNTRDNIPLNGIGRNPCSPEHRLSLICLFKGVIQK